MNWTLSSELTQWERDGMLLDEWAENFNTGRMRMIKTSIFCGDCGSSNVQMIEEPRPLKGGGTTI